MTIFALLSRLLAGNHRVVSICMMVFCLHIPAAGFSQTVTLSVTDQPLPAVLKAIKKQTAYTFFAKTHLLKKAQSVTLNLKNASIQETLEAAFKDQPFTYSIDGKIIIVEPKDSGSIVSPLPSHSLNDAGAVPRLILTGRVADQDGKPISGSSVSVRNAQQSTATDNEGRFSLQVSEGDVLIVSHISFQTKEIKITSAITAAPTLTIALSFKQNELDEAVVIAYGTTTKRMSTAAVSVVKGADLQNMPGRSIDRLLQGMVPGLQITSGSGMPGAGVANIVLRGIATGGLGIARTPLYVIDGTPITPENFNGIRVTRNTVEPTNPLAQINPADIESISVLKDAAAIALYGSRASNGVILITTKQGKAGRFNINFRHQTDISAPVKANRDVLSREQYLELMFESYKNANASWTDQAIYTDLRSKFPYQVNGSDTSFYATPDWFDELYTKNAVSVSNDLSFSGGNNKMTYYLGLGHLSENGVLKGTGFSRSSLRYNVTFKLNRWLNVGVNSAMTYSKHEYSGAASDGLTDPMGLPYYISPLLPASLQNGVLPIYYANGAGGNRIPNPIAATKYNENKADAYRGLGNLYGEVHLFPGLSFRTTLNADLLIARNKTKIDKRVDGTNPPGTGSLRELREIRSVLQINNLLRYQRSLMNKHFIDVLVSHEAQTIKSNTVQADGSGFASGFTDDEIVSATTKTSLGNNSKATFLSYFGQVNYSFRQKYSASAGVRLDGSSRFGANVPLNKFWSFGLGWVATEESFLRSARSWLNFLKIRGSIGVAGNTIAIPDYTRYDIVQPISYATTPILGATIAPSFGNPDVKAEATFNTDIGLEARLLNDRITITADIYKRMTYDMVTKVPQPLTTGRESVYANLGDIENKGIELSLSFEMIRNKSFGWSMAGNWSTNRNKLVKANNDQSSVGKHLYRVGENYESWYLVAWAGVDPADGSPQWLDKDGKVTKTYSTNNRMMLGNPQPGGFGTVTTTVRYKNFELSGMLYYAYNYKIYNAFLANGMLNDGRTQPYNNQSVLALDRWQKPGDVAMNPKRVLNNPVSSMLTSSRFLTDGDYMRLKNVRLTYNLQESMLAKLRLLNAQLFVQGNNIALWSKSDALDPDNTGTLGENNAGYPQQRSLSVGLNLNF